MSKSKSSSGQSSSKAGAFDSCKGIGKGRSGKSNKPKPKQPVPSDSRTVSMTEEDYWRFRKLIKEEKEIAEQYRKDRGLKPGSGFGMSEEDRKRYGWPKVSNEDKSRMEVYEFVEDVPDKVFAYAKIEAWNKPESRPTLNTWVGHKLGDMKIISAHTGNFGDERVSVIVRGVNGAFYHGTYFRGAGDYVRLTKSKNQETARKRWEKTPVWPDYPHELRGER